MASTKKTETQKITEPQPEPSPKLQKKSVGQLQKEYDALAKQCTELARKRQQAATVIRNEVHKEVEARISKEFAELPKLMEQKRQATIDLNEAIAEEHAAESKQ